MSDQMKLPEPGTEGSWEHAYTYKGKTISLTITEALVEQEILDQTDVKKPARKAILRATDKRIAKTLKSNIDALPKEQHDDLRWDLFIVAVDGLMANRHMSVRNDPEAAKTIAKEFPKS